MPSVFSPGDFGLAAIFGFLLLIPIASTLWLRRRALRAPAEAREAVVFSYFRFVRFGTLLGFLVWWTAADLFGLFDAAVVWAGNLGPWAEPFSFYLSGAIVWIPPILVYLFCLTLSSPIHRLRGIDYSPRQLFSASFWTTAMVVVPICLWSLAAGLFFISFRWGVLCFFSTFLVIPLLRLMLLRSRGIQIQALSTGDLHDRAFALAHNAGAPLNQLYVLSTERIRMANAFAHNRNNVLLTDYLLKNLNRREVDAVLAHELTHLKEKHLRTRQILTIVLISFYVWSLIALPDRLPPRFPLGPIFMAMVILISYVLSRFHEFAADAGAARLTQDPAAMITTLFKLSRLNTTPLHWGRVGEKLLTHPSVLRRISRLARAGNISEAAIPDLLQQAARPISDAYTLPETVSPSGKVFSTSYKVRHQFVGSIIAYPGSALILSMVALAARQLQLQGPLLWIAYALGVVLAGAVEYFLSRWVALRGQAQLNARLRRKAEQEGAPAGLASAHLVGLSPDAEPRIYELHWFWDLGFLSLAGGRLTYWGEESKFSLARDQVREIRLGPGAANWVRYPSIYLTWADENGRLSTFNIQSEEGPNLKAIRQCTETLARDLESWRIGATFSCDSLLARSVALPATTLPPPAFNKVASLDPVAVARPRAILRMELNTALSALCVAIVAGLPPQALAILFFSAGSSLEDKSIFYVVVAALLLRAIMMLPLVRLRSALKAARKNAPLLSPTFQQSTYGK